MDKNSKSPGLGQKILSILIFSCLLVAIPPSSFEEKTQETSAELSSLILDSITISELIIYEGNSLGLINNPANPESEKVVRRMNAVITAYSSTVCQTDDDPYITAAGTWVRKGIIANNLLPFGTRIKIPKLYGDKIFVVEDRMNRRAGDYRFDIWFPSYEEALNFGVERTDIEVLED